MCTGRICICLSDWKLPHSIKLLAAPLQEKSGSSGGHTMPGNVKAQRASNCAGITNDCDKTPVFQVRYFFYVYSCGFVCLALLCTFLEFTLQAFVKSEQKKLPDLFNHRVMKGRVIFFFFPAKVMLNRQFWNPFRFMKLFSHSVTVLWTTCNETVFQRYPLWGWC